MLMSLSRVAARFFVCVNKQLGTEAAGANQIISPILIHQQNRRVHSPPLLLRLADRLITQLCGLIRYPSPHPASLRDEEGILEMTGTTKVWSSTCDCGTEGLHHCGAVDSLSSGSCTSSPQKQTPPETGATLWCFREKEDDWVFCASPN